MKQETLRPEALLEQLQRVMQADPPPDMAVIYVDRHGAHHAVGRVEAGGGGLVYLVDPGWKGHA